MKVKAGCFACISKPHTDLFKTQTGTQKMKHPEYVLKIVYYRACIINLVI